MSKKFSVQEVGKDASSVKVSTTLDTFPKELMRELSMLRVVRSVISLEKNIVRVYMRTNYSSLEDAKKIVLEVLTRFFNDTELKDALQVVQNLKLDPELKEELLYVVRKFYD